ncbi:hypothetical protein SAY86_000392 [Trapa natans]|uniref:Uncharacterized protein n=1 Tax=Trapa natans TaxID=22666 RepID=A0AAN7RDW2_TRANT|nr:hypothetical protein SAY86_000392 [Trapa natans]
MRCEPHESAKWRSEPRFVKWISIRHSELPKIISLCRLPSIERISSPVFFSSGPLDQDVKKEVLTPVDPHVTLDIVEQSAVDPEIKKVAATPVDLHTGFETVEQAKKLGAPNKLSVVQDIKEEAERPVDPSMELHASNKPKHLGDPIRF